MMILDPVLGSKTRKTSEKRGYKGPRAVCCHCYHEIKGKIYYYDDKPLDEYCWQFRYILFELEEDDEEKKELLKQALNRDREKADS